MRKAVNESGVGRPSPLTAGTVVSKSFLCKGFDGLWLLTGVGINGVSTRSHSSSLRNWYYWPSVLPTPCTAGLSNRCHSRSIPVAMYWPAIGTIRPRRAGCSPVVICDADNRWWSGRFEKAVNVPAPWIATCPAAVACHGFKHEVQSIQDTAVPPVLFRLHGPYATNSPEPTTQMKCLCSFRDIMASIYSAINSVNTARPIALIKLIRE